MGANPWAYFLPYREDIAAALEDLRQAEFAAGRYYQFDKLRGPYATVDEALANSGDTGTRSILDMISVADSPRNPEWSGASEYQVGFDSGEDPMFSLLAPLTSEQLIRLYGTNRPSREIIIRNSRFFNYLDRGLGLYIIVYEDDKPSELFFAGYSFD